LTQLRIYSYFDNLQQCMAGNNKQTLRIHAKNNSKRDDIDTHTQHKKTSTRSKQCITTSISDDNATVICNWCTRLKIDICQQTAVHSLINLILIFGRFDRLTSLTGLTKYNLLAPLCLPSPVSPAEHSIQGSAQLGRRVNGDGVLIQRSSPLQLQQASQQSEATCDPISITPAAGRATWCDPATCGLRRHRYALGMLALTHRLSRVALLTHKLHVGCLFT